MSKLLELQSECDKILLRWFNDDKKLVCLNLTTKMQILSLLPAYAFCRPGDKNLALLENVDIIGWVKNFVDVSEKTETQYRRGLITLDSVLMRSLEE